MLIQVSLYFHIPFPNSMGFKPVQLDPTQGAVRQANRRKTLQLPPAPSAMNPPEVRKNANPRADGDYFDIRNWPDQLEFHSLHPISTIFSCQTGNSTATGTGGRTKAPESFRRSISRKHSRPPFLVAHCPRGSCRGGRISYFG